MNKFNIGKKALNYLDTYWVGNEGVSKLNVVKIIEVNSNFDIKVKGIALTQITQGFSNIGSDPVLAQYTLNHNISFRVNDLDPLGPDRSIEAPLRLNGKYKLIELIDGSEPILILGNKRLFRKLTTKEQLYCFPEGYQLKAPTNF